MIKIYHNTRCGKSREGLALLQQSGKDFETINYLVNPPTKMQLQEIIKKLGIKPMDLIRKSETIWKELYQGKLLDDQGLVDAMVSHPILIERPIVINGDQAVVARPAEKILTII